MDIKRTPLIGSMAIAWSLGLALTPPAQAAVIPCELTVDVGSTMPLRWDDEAHAVFRHEATRLWLPEGIRVCWTGTTPCPEAPMLYVRVVPQVPAGTPDARPALGWMGFSDRSGPGPLILLSLTWIADMVGRAERGARTLAELPGMVARLLPRALGRALAHELGHYLLVRREHARAGLMRAAFRPEDLVDEGTGQRLALTAADRRQLRTRCGRTAVLVTRNPRNP
jgi:hypothetical protein